MKAVLQAETAYNTRFRSRIKSEAREAKADNQVSESKYSTIREILTVAFATPAALGVIAKIDKRLDFLPLLERIVLKYQVFLDFVGKKLSELLSIEWINIDTLMFSVFVTLQLVVGRFYTDKHESDGSPSLLWGYGSVVSIVVFSFVFNAGEGTRLGSEVFPSILAIVCGIVFVSMLIIGLAEIVREPRFDKATIIFFSITLAFGVLTIVAGRNFFSSWYLMQSSGFMNSFVSVFFFVYFMILVIIARNIGAKGPSYVILWVLGIYTTNWIGSEFLPQAHEILERIGV